MNAKKGKALADQLVEDLLGDDNLASAPVTAKTKKYSKDLSITSVNDASVADVDSDIVIDLSSEGETGELMDEGSRTVALAEIAEDESVDAPGTIDRGLQESESRGSATDEVYTSNWKVTPEARSSSRKGGVTEAFLSQSESLKIAQEKILELENEIERLRVENEELGAAAETLRRRTDENLASLERLTAKQERAKEDFEEEKEVLLTSLDAKERGSDELKLKVEELEMRLSTNIQKIRVRERELENRLELIKLEGSAMLRSKDELILDLKRQLDHLNHELENYRVKGQEMNQQLGERDDVLRRTVKALRIALSMLEGSGESAPLLKKAK